MRENLAVKHLGAIAKLAFQHWKRLPEHAKAYISVEDMVSEAVLRVTTVSKRYQKRRAGTVTFVWKVADNQCRVVVNRFKQHMRRAAGVVPIEDLPLSRKDEERKFRESRIAVERVIQDASDDLRERLQEFLDERRYYAWPKETLEEAQRLARKHNATYTDFERVLRRV